METKERMQIKKDLANKQIIITRLFDATPDVVWSAWTEPEYLDQWWAPEPWTAETGSMDFREGGKWSYAMVSPEGQKHWALVTYTKISKGKFFEGKDNFCDDKGNVNTALPSTGWRVEFQETNTGTKAVVTMTYATEADLKTILEMGFEQGFTATLSALDRYFKEGFKLRKENKNNKMSRVVTYLNFPGNAEEAFNFYKTVFGTEFIGKGLQRFGDIPAESGHPPVPDNIKKMILHVELPVLGGHVIMATDAPKEMGFDLQSGNNMHICLEPSTRVETEKLFNALSEGGKVSMPLADMFFGAYFGELKDKFGINWMFNCFEKK